MAKKKVDFVISEKGAAKTKQGLKGVDKQLMSMAKNAIGLGVALAAVTKAAQLTKLASDAVNVEKAFRNLAKEPDKMLQAMKTAVAGTIQEFALMKQFNQAALLGLPLDRFDEMLAIARSSAQATGQSMEFMLNSIVTGIGRQSRLMIDNLGLIVSIGDANEVYAKQLGKLSSELTQVEQKTAFANAVLKAGGDNLVKMGGSAEGAFDGVNKLGSILADTGIAIGKEIVPHVNDFADALADVLTGMNELQKFGKEDNVVFVDPTRTEQIESFRKSISELAGKDLIDLRDAYSALAQKQGMTVITGEQINLADMVKATNEVLNEQIRLLGGDVPTAIREHSDLMEIAIKDTSDSLNDLRTDAQKVTEAIDGMTESMVRALIEGQDLGDALESVLKSIAIKGITAIVLGAIGAATGGAAFNLAGILAGAFGAATGADFVTDGPQLMMVGEAGREQVSVTPLEGPNLNGPQGGITIQVMGDFIGNQDFVEGTLIPAINLAQNQGRASIA